MNDKFLWKRDYKYINWEKTLIVNSLRAGATGCVYLVFFLFALLTEGQHSNFETQFIFVLIFIPIIAPIAYLIIYLPIGLICTFLSNKGVPFVGWFSLLLSIVLMLGDPLIYIIKKVKPNLVPVEYYSLINFTMIIFVLEK